MAMSVCLCVIKSIAVSSLGLYAGILTTSTVLSSLSPTATILSSLDIVTRTHLKPLLNKLFLTANVFGSVATGFFAMSYFGAPPAVRHPYLFYSMLVAPLSSIYLYIVKSNIERETLVQGDDTSADTARTSIKLSESSETEDEAYTGAVPTLGKRSLRAVGHLLLATTVAVLGFTQSVVGLYGEGQFA